MGYKLGTTSLKNLEGVHPDLVRVVKRAIAISLADFGVSEGVRTLEKQREYYNKGDSTTMNSKHLVQTDGYSHAVDLFGYTKGGTDYTSSTMRAIMQAMVTAAIEEGVQLRIGGLWRTFVDSPHYELNGAYYD